MNPQTEKMFYDIVRQTAFKGAISATQFHYLKPLFDELAQLQDLNVHQKAYILATAHHETDDFRVMLEYASGTAYEGRADLGNTSKGDGPRFKGRGYPMLTGRRNYGLASKLLDLDLIGTPQFAAYPKHSAKIIISGMCDGWFTGHRLSRYVNDLSVDYRNARKVVNALDRANDIAHLAMQYEAALIEAENHNIPGVEKFPEEEEGQSPPDGEAEQLETVPMSNTRLGTAGVIATSIWTIVNASGILPPQMQTPEVAGAATGLLATLATVIANLQIWSGSRRSNHKGE